jgi:tRNA uridine 5-carbamoylmethylation protein Kti12
MDEASRRSSAKCVCLVMGIPGAGKSALAKAVSSRSSDVGGVVVIELDDLMHGIREHHSSGETLFDSQHWQAAWKSFCSRIEAQLAGTDPAGDVVMAVDTFHFASMRLSVWRLVRDENTRRHASGLPLHSFTQILVNTSLEVALSRNERRPGIERIPCDVVQRTAAVMDSCSDTTRLASRIGAPLVLDGTATCDALADQAVKFVLEERLRADRHPSRSSLPSSLADQQALAHHIDLAMRKVCSDLISASASEQKREVSSICAKGKKTFAGLLKSQRLFERGCVLDLNEASEAAQRYSAEFAVFLANLSRFREKS